MLRIAFSFLGILLFNISSAQLQADFHCMGIGFDATNCIYLADISVPGSSPIVRWHWDFGNGDTSNMQNITGAISINQGQPCYDSLGSFNVCLTVFDANGDSSQKCKLNYVTHDSTGIHCNWFVGISEFSISDLHIYPNPVKNIFNISTNSFQETEIVIYDLMARNIAHKVFINSLVIDMSQLPSGLYFFQLGYKNNFTYSGKFIKE